MSSEELPAERRPITSPALVVEGGLALVAFVLAWFFTLPLSDNITWTASGFAQGILATLPLVVSLLLLDRWPLGPIRGLKVVMQDSILPLFRECSIGELLMISIAAGVGEELLFRGVGQLGIERLGGSAWLAVAIASALFGLAHPISTTYVVLAAFIGAYLGGLFVATGNLLVPIVAHAAYDFVALVYLLHVSQQGQSHER